MKSKAPHVLAAFINAIAEEGTKEEAVQFLQETWNDYCEVKRLLAEATVLLHNQAQAVIAMNTARPAGLANEPTDAMIEAIASAFRESTCFDDVPFDTDRDAARDAYQRLRALVSTLAPLDAAGMPKQEATMLERIAIQALNEVKAWRDSDCNERFPQGTRMKIEAALMLYEQRRIHRPFSIQEPKP